MKKVLVIAIVSILSSTINAQVKTVQNLNTTNGTVYYDLDAGKETDKNSKDWDISFNRTTIGVNGNGKAAGQIITTSFAKVTKTPTTPFKTDKDQTYAIPTGSGNGWYTYNPEDHVISPIADRTIVVKSGTGTVYKIAIKSYYQDSQAYNPGGYYNFDYEVIK